MENEKKKNIKINKNYFLCTRVGEKGKEREKKNTYSLRAYL